MNVVVITTREEAYHRHLCAELAKRHSVVGILHPQPPRWEGPERRRLRHRQRERYGVWHQLLVKLARNRWGWSAGWNEREDLRRAQARFFPHANAEYERSAASVAHSVPDVNAPAGVALLRSLEPDVVVCSGGPIYKARLIEAAPLMLNFHTGISPLYNGSRTVFWTFANGQPHLTGGTLMRMSAAVDGGDVLAHYLPRVDPDDTPASLFMKCIQGGIELYDRLLADLRDGRPCTAVPQGRPFHLYVDDDWTVYQTLAIERHLRSRLCERRTRPERVFTYWRMGRVEAETAFRETLLQLVTHG